MGERSCQANILAGWDAEGVTPYESGGKLSGKRTLIRSILWRESVKGPPKGKGCSHRTEVNLSGNKDRGDL
jgi:hypothetical protein